jgi:hypothetical protein
VAIWAFDDAENRVARTNRKIRDACVAQTRARTEIKYGETLEPAPALGFTAFRVFLLAVQCD